MKKWPEDGSPVRFEDLARPLADWLRNRDARERRLPYDGYELGGRESTGCLQPDEALSPESISYGIEHQGRDSYDVAVGIAIQLGMEQGRRLEGRRAGPLRVIDALLLPEVQAGKKWIALPLPGGIVLPTQTLGVCRGRLRWCDGHHQPGAIRPTHFGGEATLGLPQLLGPCTLIDAE